MNNNTVSNQETEVPKTSEMNDSDYLNDILAAEKKLGTDYATVMNESSNDELYEEIGKICKETKDEGRKLFNLLFKKGWYQLDKAEMQKINTVVQEYQDKLNELS